jgi:hypothetical protein
VSQASGKRAGVKRSFALRARWYSSSAFFGSFFKT